MEDVQGLVAAFREQGELEEAIALQRMALRNCPVCSSEEVKCSSFYYVVLGDLLLQARDTNGAKGGTM